MSSRFDAQLNLIRSIAGTIVCICLAFVSNFASAQFFNGAQLQTIGGVLIDAKGVVQTSNPTLDSKTRDAILAQMEKADGHLAKSANLRVISLRGLNEEIKQAVDAKRKISDEAQYLAGLVSVKYVFLVPEKNDVLICGPAEAWKVDAQGNVVGTKTGRPVLRLEDLMVALRTSSNARTGYGISVSINPTERANKNYVKFMDQVQRAGASFSQRAAAALEEVMGPQDIVLTGVDTDSRYARVLVAADYQMKRLSMGFEQTPVKQVPSFLSLCQQSNSRLRSLTPRFWMEMDYQPIKTTQDKLAWEIDGSVKALTENQVVEKSGKRSGTGRTNPLAKKWADNMTKHFEALATKVPVFAELENIMDLSVVAALIEKEQMLERVDLELPYLMDKKKLATPSLAAPKTVPTQCSFCSLKRGTLVTASGGVQIDSWSVLDRQVTDAKVAQVRQQTLAAAGNQWYWNAK